MADDHAAASAQVLTNPDLLHGIFVFMPLAPSLPTEMLQRDSYLARCATTCRNFHEPAIRVLWRNLQSLLPLWHLLAPPDTPFPFSYFYNRGLYNHEDALRYLQKVSSAQLHLDPIRWEHFLWHAAHVRVLTHATHGQKEMDHVDRLLMHSVVMQNGGTTVLPLLHTIHWRARKLVDLTLISLFTPTLRHATLYSSQDDEGELVLFLRRLHESSPFLKTINIGSGLNANAMVIQEVLSFPQLDRIQIPRTGLEGFQALATKPNLTFLEVHILTGPLIRLDRVVSVSNLRDLSIGGDESTIFDLFNFIHFQALKSAKIVIQDSVTETQVAPAYITQFLARFYNAVSTSGLRTLELVVEPRPPHSPRGSEPTLRALLAPLLPVHDFRSFRLTTMSQLASIDDADIEALASAWPKVEHLFIHDGITPESTLSIRAIHHLYVRCTDLTELSISSLSFPIIGVHEIPAPLDRPVIHPLRFLDMRGQVILKTSVTSLVPDLSDEGAEAMARYLLELFPCLDGRRYKREWDNSAPEVLGLLPDGLHFDERWRNIIGHICAIGSAARDKF